MARIAVARSANYAGVYEYVLEQVTAAAESPSHRRCLEAMRAGEAVRVPSWVLPPEVKQSAAFLAATRGVGRWGNPFVRSVMATVFSDGRVGYDAETAADWMAEYMPDDVVDWRDF